MNEEKDALERLRVKYAKRRWLKNQQKSCLTYKKLIKWLDKLEFTPSINDIETSINLSYTQSDAGQTP